MNDITSIVPAKYDDIFRIFAESYLETIKSQAIVIDDGLSVAVKNKYPSFRYIESPKPFGFAKSVNVGIKAAKGADVIVWNDDCYIHTANLDRKLSTVAYAEEDIGLVTPVMNNVQNAMQHPENQEPREKCSLVGNIPCISFLGIISFGCVYLKRSALEVVGLLDEVFVIGREDMDFGLRLKKANLKVAICYSAFVEHGGNKFERKTSNTRLRAGNGGNSEEGFAYFRRKWGHE